MFKNLYLGELKKMFSLKTALIFLAIFVFGFIIVGLSLQSIQNISDVSIGGVPTSQSNRINVDDDQASAALVFLREELARAKVEKAQYGYKYYISLFSPGDEVYHVKSQIAVYEYIIDNNLYNTDVYYYDNTLYSLSFFQEKVATPFAVTMIGVFSFLLSIYALIIGSGAYAGEMRNGTLKILLLNPISRNQLTLAKLLSMLTILGGAVMTVFLCITAYSHIAYNDPPQNMLYVFNAHSVFCAGYSFPLFLSWMSLLFSTFAYGIMAFFFGTITRKRILGFVLPYALDFAAPIIGIAGLSRFWITEVIDLSAFFGTGIAINAGSNFFLSLSLAIIYFGAMIALSFIVFNKKDVA